MTRVSPPQALRLAAPCVTRQSKSQARTPNTHTHTHTFTPPRNLSSPSGVREGFQWGGRGSLANCFEAKAHRRRTVAVTEQRGEKGQKRGEDTKGFKGTSFLLHASIPQSL